MEFRKTAATLFAVRGRKSSAVGETKILRTRSYLLTVAVFIFVLCGLSVGGFRVFADTYKTPEMSSVFGTDISDLTTVELEEALEDLKLSKFTVINGQKYRSYSLEEMGITFDTKDTALNAALGKDNGVWTHTSGKHVLKPEVTFDAKKFKEFELQMLASSKDAVDAKIVIEEGALVVVPSANGIGITVDSVLSQISDASSKGENGISLLPQLIAPLYTTSRAQEDFEKAKLFSEGAVEVRAGEITANIPNIDVMRISRQVDSYVSEYGYDADKLYDAVKRVATDNSDSAWNEIYELRGGQKVILREGRNGVVHTGIQDIVDSVIDSGLDGSIRKVTLESKQETYSSLEKLEANTWIDINLTTHTMTLWENNSIQATFPISGGKEETSTPLGDYKISSKVRKMTMSGPGYSTPNIEYVSWFKFNYAIHSAYWHDEFGKANVSHGCVNSRVDDARYVYEWAPIGTKVSVHY